MARVQVPQDLSISELWVRVTRYLEELEAGLVTHDNQIANLRKLRRARAHLKEIRLRGTQLSLPEDREG